MSADGDRAQRFDQLTRLIATAMSRRQMLRLAGGAALAALSACVPGPTPKPTTTPPRTSTASSNTTTGTTTSPPDVLASWCPEDPVTAASLAAALAMPKTAARVPLSPKGCVELQRTPDGGTPTSQKLLVNGKPVIALQTSADVVTLERDANADGFAESVTTFTPATGTRQDTLSDTTTRQAQRRTTLTPQADTDAIQVELRDDTGAWVAEGGYLASHDVGYESPGIATFPPAAIGPSMVAAATCTAAQNDYLRARLQHGYQTGMNCLDHNKARDLGFELAFQLAVRDVEFTCAYKGAGSCRGHLDPQSYRDPSAPIHISVDWDCYTTTLSEYEQASVMFHELLHLVLGPHDIGNKDYPRYSEMDRVTACEHLCFGPGDVTACSCATCLQTTSCDERCRILPQCEERLGYRCPCQAGKNANKVFSSCSQCLSTCPSGLACFGISTCKVEYVGCDTPPTCP